jgi:hypothetical protein
MPEKSIGIARLLSVSILYFYSLLILTRLRQKIKKRHFCRTVTLARKSDMRVEPAK